MRDYSRVIISPKHTGGACLLFKHLQLIFHGLEIGKDLHHIIDPAVMKRASPDRNDNGRGRLIVVIIMKPDEPGCGGLYVT